MERKQGLRRNLASVAGTALVLLSGIFKNGMEQNVAHMRIRMQHGTPIFNSRRLQPGHGGTPNKYKPHVGTKQIARELRRRLQENMRCEAIVAEREANGQFGVGA